MFKNPPRPPRRWPRPPLPTPTPWGGPTPGLAPPRGPAESPPTPPPDSDAPADAPPPPQTPEAPPRPSTIATASSDQILQALHDIALQMNASNQIVNGNLQQISAHLDQLGTNFALYQQKHLELLATHILETKNLALATLAQGQAVKDIWRVLAASTHTPPVSPAPASAQPPKGEPFNVREVL